VPPARGHRRAEPDNEEEDEVDWSDEDEPQATQPLARTAQVPTKSILKKSQAAPTLVIEASPPPSAKVSRVVKDRLAQDDAEIAALEKRLGMKRKKKSEGTGDGLDDIFGDLGDFGSDEDDVRPNPTKRKRHQDDEWLATKRRKALGEPMEDEDSDLAGLDSDALDSDEGLSVEEDGEGPEDDGDSETDDTGVNRPGSEGFDAENEVEDTPIRVRENPYVAPVPAGAAPAKYIPPALRAPPSSDAEALARLRRQTQGLLNRLSDANMMSIIKDIEKLYQNNPRGYVTTTLIDLLIGMLSDPTTLIDTFLILHAGFIAAVYKVIGPDFGAQMLERIVLEFDRHYQANKAGDGKHTTNLTSVLAELYCFQVVGCKLIFDYIKLFLDELSEINTELLLRIVRVSGSQLRLDDPSSLKDIVILLQKSVTRVGEKNLPVRTKFMIETINDLKNNRMKTGVAASTLVREHTISMKKQLGTLNTRSLKGSEPLRIGLTDIRDTDKKGKWWLVGASWRSNMAGEPQEQKGKNDEDEEGHVDAADTGDDAEVDLLQLAKEQRMNTDIRRAIFVTIMSSSDYKDAHVRLLKLRLKKAEEVEIPRVILHCAGCEDLYNPYYTALARKFCTDHKSRKTFQFVLWDIFRKLGEKKDDDDASDDEDNLESDMSLRRIVTLGKLYGTLIANGDLAIVGLKTLNFPYLKPKTKTLVEVILVTVILESQKGHKGKRSEKALLNIFINADAVPEMITGLQYFVKKVVSKTEITANSKEKDTVKWACKVIMGLLERLMATTTFEED
jgi:nucleolar MIF4G domain-containing protein 1